MTSSEERLLLAAYGPPVLPRPQVRTWTMPGRLPFDVEGRQKSRGIVAQIN